MKPMKLKRDTLLTLAAIAAFVLLLVIVELFFDSYTKRIFNLCAVYIVLALSLNLINGFTGMFSLGHAGFMAVGAYVCALLTMSAAQKDMNYFLTPIVPFLHNLTLPFLPSLLIAGLAAGLIGFLIGAPVLRLRDDYLAIATLGFAEIIRVLITNFQPITNGAQGLKGLPKYASTWWVWGCAALATIFMILLMRSSYGRAIKAVRDDEIAAEAMGVNVFRVKVVSFTVASFMAGVGGALMGHMISTIDPKMFTFTLTYNIVLIVVLGGSGSISGSIIGAVLVTIGMELLRFLDEPMDFGLFQTPGIPGIRMVVFSILLMVVVIFRQRGLMGNRELSWSGIADAFRGSGLLPRKKRSLRDEAASASARSSEDKEDGRE